MHTGQYPSGLRSSGLQLRRPGDSGGAGDHEVQFLGSGRAIAIGIQLEDDRFSTVTP